MGGQFNFSNYSDFSKKSEELKNYVEMTPEMQAEVEAAKKAAEKAELQGGLNGNKGKDLTKGVTVDGVKPLSNEELAARFGEIREADPAWKRLLNNVYHHSKNFVKEFGEAVTGGAIIVLKGAACALGVFASCSSEDDDLPDIGAKAELEYNPKSFEVVNNRCKILNMSDEDFDAAINANDLLRDSEKARLTALDFSRKTSDGVKFSYGAEKSSDGTGNAYINVPEGQNGIKLYLDSASQIPAGDVIKYIDVLKPDLKCDDEKLHFEDKNGAPQVVVDNGFTHKVGDSVQVKENSALGAMKTLVSAMGFNDAQEPMQISENNLLLDLKVGQGAYTNEQNDFAKNTNFSFELVERGDLNNITNGNPQVKMKVFGQEISGKLFNENGNVIVKDDKGEELVRLSQKQGYNLGSDEEPDNYDGVLIEVKGKEYAFIWDGDMGKIDRENGTFMTTYKSVHNDFNTQGLGEADRYYKEKQDNLGDARSLARNNFNALKEILRTEATANATLDWN